MCPGGIPATPTRTGPGTHGRDRSWKQEKERVFVGFYRPDVYNQPEVFGLELVGSIDWADAYEFDIIAVFRMPETGEWFYAQDAGCSCPSPFEGFTSLFDLTAASQAKIQQVLEAKNNDEASCYRPKDRSMDVAALLERMWAL